MSLLGGSLQRDMHGRPIGWGSYEEEDNPLGFLEPVLSMGSSMVAEPIAGLAGLLTLGAGGGSGGATDVIERTRDALTYRPRSAEGQRIMGGIGETVAPVGEFLEQFSEVPGDWVFEQTGSPMLSAAAYSVAPALAEVLGFKGAGKAGLFDIGDQYEIGDIGGAGYERGAVGVPKREAKALAEVPGYRRTAKYLTDAERAQLDHNNAVRSAQAIQGYKKNYPSPAEQSVISRAGGAKAGWYPESEYAIGTVFGPDQRRFTGLTSALSPQNSVEGNLRNTLNTWVNWDQAGRPQLIPEILEIMGRSVEGDKGIASVMDAWRNNSYRSLLVPEGEELVLSGPKVNSFYQNLMGNRNEITNDAWMANYGLVDQNIFGGSGKGRDAIGEVGGKGPGYLAANASTREAAELLGVDPSEIQETIWSWGKTLLEGSEGAGMSPTEYLRMGLLTDEAIGGTPAFGDMFQLDPEFRGILERGGYGPQLGLLEPPAPKVMSDPYTRIGVEPGNMHETPEGRHMLRAAGRLDRLQARRKAEAEIRAAALEMRDVMSEGPPTKKELMAAAKKVLRNRKKLLAEQKRSPNVTTKRKDRILFGI